MDDKLTIEWRKSTYSGGGGSNCVEAGAVPGAVLVRDTVNRDGAVLRIGAAAWSTFTDSLK